MATKGKRLRKVGRMPKPRRASVTRAELDRAIDLLNERGEIINKIRLQVEENACAIEVQFTRMAQMQADLDQIKRNSNR